MLWALTWRKKQDLSNLFKNPDNGKFSATTDLWSSGNKFAMMAVTVSWIDRNFEMNEAVIGFRQLSGQHTGLNIAELFENVLREFKIERKVSKSWSQILEGLVYFLKINFLTFPLFQLMCVTTDNASSNGTFINHLSDKLSCLDGGFKADNWIRCFAHVINLAVKESLDPMKDLIQTVQFPKTHTFYSNFLTCWIIF